MTPDTRARLSGMLHELRDLTGLPDSAAEDLATRYLSVVRGVLESHANGTMGTEPDARHTGRAERVTRKLQRS